MRRRAREARCVLLRRPRGFVSNCGHLVDI
jgi:hypothetical protein